MHKPESRLLIVPGAAAITGEKSERCEKARRGDMERKKGSIFGNCIVPIHQVCRSRKIAINRVIAETADARRTGVIAGSRIVGEPGHAAINSIRAAACRIGGKSPGNIFIPRRSLQRGVVCPGGIEAAVEV